MNPLRDDPIINARKAVLDAQKALAERPGPTAALVVQRAQQAWNSMKRLRVV